MERHLSRHVARWQVNGLVDGKAHRDRRLDGTRRGAGQHISDRSKLGADGAGERDPLRGQVRAAAAGGPFLVKEWRRTSSHRMLRSYPTDPGVDGRLAVGAD
jgi:hypothetical protein